MIFYRKVGARRRMWWDVLTHLGASPQMPRILGHICLTACGEPTVKHHNYSKLHFYKNFVRRFEGLHVHHTTTPSFCLGGEFQNRRRIIRTGTSTSKYEKKNCLSYTTSTYRGRFLFFVQQCEKNCIILHNLNGRVLI